MVNQLRKQQEGRDGAQASSVATSKVGHLKAQEFQQDSCSHTIILLANNVPGEYISKNNNKAIRK